VLKAYIDARRPSFFLRSVNNVVKFSPIVGISKDKRLIYYDIHTICLSLFRSIKGTLVSIKAVNIYQRSQKLMVVLSIFSYNFPLSFLLSLSRSLDFPRELTLFFSFPSASKSFVTHFPSFSSFQFQFNFSTDDSCYHSSL
jgi:hypothetical protein